MEQVYTPQKDYKVLVRCFTYNHSKYIEDTLNGFAMQKTDFPFVCLVMDDASTDGEQKVIKAWMERECNMPQAENIEIEKSFITLVPHKTNSNCTFVFYFLKENLYKTGGKTPMITPWREHCKYEALCEGDDYWIHPGKLQMQVDFLDENEEYGLCYGNAEVFYEKLRRFDNKLTGFEYVDFEQLMQTNPIPTLTVLYRIDLSEKYITDVNPSCRQWLMGDYPKWIWFALNSKLHYCPVDFAVRRVLEESASFSSNLKNNIAFIDNTKQIRLFFVNKYNLGLELVEIIEDQFYKECAAASLGKKDFANYRKYVKNIKRKSFREQMYLLVFLYHSLFR